MSDKSTSYRVAIPANIRLKETPWPLDTWPPNNPYSLPKITRMPDLATFYGNTYSTIERER